MAYLLSYCKNFINFLGQLTSTLYTSWALVLLTTVTVLLIITILGKKARRCNLPGPLGWPIVGSFPELWGKYPSRVFFEMRKLYGPVFQIKLGLDTVVVMNSIETIQRASTDINFADRPNLTTMKGRLHGTTQGFFLSLNANDKWRFLRKATSRSLGMFASSKNSKLEMISNEAKTSLFSIIDEQQGNSFDPRSAIFRTVTAVIASLIYGSDYDPNSEILKVIEQQCWTSGQFLSLTNPINRFPFGKVYLNRHLTREYYKYFLSLIDMTRGHAKKEHDHEEIRDVSDALFKILLEISPEEFAKIGCDGDAIVQSASQLFSAGFLTTLDNFHFLLNYMAYFQDVQKKVQIEIDAVLQDRAVTLDDKPKLPYVEAVINEMFRFATPVPLSVQHATACDLLFDGYFIPQGTEVVLNLYAIHMDPEIFYEPDQFKPERFITSDGLFNCELAQKVQTFGIGKRRCIGEVMARQELLMLFVGMLQRYTWTVAPGEVEEHGLFWESGGLSRITHPWKLSFRLRKQNVID